MKLVDNFKIHSYLKHSALVLDIVCVNDWTLPIVGQDICIIFESKNKVPYLTTKLDLSTMERRMFHKQKFA